MIAIASTIGRDEVASAEAGQPAPDAGPRGRAGPPAGVGAAAGGGQHGVRDRVFLDLLAAQFGDHVAGREDDDPVAQAGQLADVGRGHDDHAGAAVGDLAQDPVDLGAGADVDALGGFLGQQQAGVLVQQRPGQQDLLLVAAGQAEDVGVDRGGLDRQAVALGFDGAVLGAAVHDAAAAELPERRDDGVLADGQSAEQALVQPVRREVDGARLERGLRPGGLELWCRAARRCRWRDQAGHRAQELALAVADDAGHADDLAPGDGQGDVAEGRGWRSSRPPGPVPDPVAGAGLSRDALSRELGRDLAADDQLQQLRVRDVSRPGTSPGPRRRAGR